MQKKYKPKHNWEGKVINRELNMSFKFDHSNKCYLHKPESVRQMTTIKLSGISRYKRITLSRPEDKTLCLLKKKNDLPSSGFCHSDGSQNESKSKRNDLQIFLPCSKTKK